jgi:GT2 family glycosyltransferase/2-polyprenyl-3-methyl-5-hydroxy-6-metoxy-1,4-benzoquinol methylase
VRTAELTVAIPTHDRWEILERTLRALAAQTAQGFETIVVVDGAGGSRPAWLAELDGIRVLEQERAGPGVARNLAARASQRPLLLFLGDDMIPAPDLIERHVARHAGEPASEVAVLGHVRWHPEVAGRRLERWLDWSGAQFDYRQLEREPGPEAGFGRFYSCNVSLKRALFEEAGGFDPGFRFDYEDLDLGWRLHQRGMRLIYEPRAVAHHLHAHDWEDIERRYESRARAERLMVTKHDWFSPWFYERIRSHADHRPVSRGWPYLVDLVPPRARVLRRVAEQRADRWYHQRLARPFLRAWEGERELEELRAYLGSSYDHERLIQHRDLVDAEAGAVGEEARFYRTSESYLYDLTAFAMSGVKEPYRRVVESLVAPGARLLDYGCGIGSDGLRLIEDGYRVAFAEFDNPSSRYLRWRLAHRGLSAEVHDLDEGVPGGFDAAYAFDVIEHVDDPFAFLAELEQRAEIVVVNLLEELDGDTPLHRPLPIGAILSRATAHGLLRYGRYHGRSHLIAYRSTPRSGARQRLGSLSRRVLGQLRRD